MHPPKHTDKAFPLCANLRTGKASRRISTACCRKCSYSRNTVAEHNFLQTLSTSSKPHKHPKRKRRAWPWTRRRARGGCAAAACSSSCGRASCSTTASCGSASTARAPSGSSDPHRSGWPPDALGSTCSTAKYLSHIRHARRRAIRSWLQCVLVIMAIDASNHKHAASLIYISCPACTKSQAKAVRLGRAP